MSHPYIENHHIETSAKKHQDDRISSQEHLTNKPILIDGPSLLSLTISWCLSPHFFVLDYQSPNNTLNLPATNYFHKAEKGTIGEKLLFPSSYQSDRSHQTQFL